MNKYANISLRILALILLVVSLSGCLGSKPKTPAAPPATETATEPVEAAPAGGNELPPTFTPAAEEPAAPTAVQAAEAAATETPAPTEAPPEATATPTVEAAAPTAAPAAADDGETYEPIPGCARSRLHWPDIVRISVHIEYVRIRSTPDTHPSDNIVRKLYRSELAQIIGQPVCNYGWILWPIRTADGTKGWVPESDGTSFWLVNYNGYFFPTVTPRSQ